MISAVFTRNQEQNILEFRITGHADSGPYGQDIVCAAVSALAITTVNGLKQVVHVNPKIISNETDGGLLKVLQLDERKESQILLETFANGISDIAANYPDNIKVKNIDN
ncbi:ribosomal-processing cysteine protease Prp [Paucilactobacillus wasatchensis]|uniref:Ribosomal processing cysteine protease Prp n=1 Tax=Paucilactobacillus wasatchensis TaxID=1335616 RepID=A0A0D1ABT7_9LACO|nr:ribosomal-processing cysteine protease Prp [Paucilactobacillus wasatchensis]KIS04126.1 ribosomal like protein [Paucilactobacillus wasatchensis]